MGSHTPHSTHTYKQHTPCSMLHATQSKRFVMIMFNYQIYNNIMLVSRYVETLYQTPLIRLQKNKKNKFQCCSYAYTKFLRLEKLNGDFRELIRARETKLLFQKKVYWMPLTNVQSNKTINEIKQHSSRIKGPAAEKKVEK